MIIKLFQYVEKDIPSVICSDVEELVAMLLLHRNMSPEEVDLKLGNDGGQGTLKVTLSMTLKPEFEVSTSPKPKRFQYSEGYGDGGDFKFSSIHKAIILALVPTMNESYVNLRTLLDKLNIGALDCSHSEDIKVMLQILGKQPASSTHPCPFCESSKPLMEKANPNTLASLLSWHDKWLAAGGKHKDLKKFQNVMHKPLLTGNPDSEIIELLNVPGLHILLGIVDKLLCEMEKSLFEAQETGIVFFDTYLKSINLSRVCYQGQHRLEGNGCNQFLKKIDKLEQCFKENSLGLQGAKFITVFRDFNKVVDGCFGKKVSSSYKEDIERFSRSFRDLGTKLPVKFHIVEQHLSEFIEMKGGHYGKNLNLFK